MFDAFVATVAAGVSVFFVFMIGARFRLRFIQTIARKMMWIVAGIWTIGLCQHLVDAPTIVALVLTAVVWVVIIGRAIGRRRHHPAVGAGAHR
ncbi:hypothetical protein [Subtercola vilae]|uniref:Uncharacterized protein n=1 Tax=Subtercola vilae TaxID=2056433 RepID=A0A4T2BHB7_9MICO|nr:hypothetical protein [Subtercola vilae]TIH28446.1 hypothetical protein D4765_18455 [Subtercola vilae]